MAKRRVVITGMGLITPLGIGVDATWTGLIEGRSGIGPITRFDATDLPTRIAGEIKDWDASPWLRRPERRRTAHFIQYGIAAAHLAYASAGLDKTPPDPERFGCTISSGMGGMPTVEETVESYREKGQRFGISPYFIPTILVNMVAGQVAIRLQCKGPNMSVVSACATGAHSIGEAARIIERGDADVMLAGGAEATINALTIGGFCSARAMSERNDDPQAASRPFTASRDGFVLGEGAAVLVLESWEHAQQRGADILAEIVGYAANCDAHHITAPAPEGEGAQRCMRRAIADANIAPDAIGYVNAHGTSTAADAVESHAIRAVFGAHADTVAVSSTKSMHGHLLGATGALEAAICTLALRRGVLPPTINLDDPDPACDLDYIPHTARELQVEYAMSNNFGFGGTNAALILRRV